MPWWRLDYNWELMFDIWGGKSHDYVTYGNQYILGFYRALFFTNFADWNDFLGWKVIIIIYWVFYATLVFFSAILVPIGWHHGHWWGAIFAFGFLCFCMFVATFFLPLVLFLILLGLCYWIYKKNVAFDLRSIREHKRNFKLHGYSTFGNGYYKNKKNNILSNCPSAKYLRKWLIRNNFVIIKNPDDCCFEVTYGRPKKNFKVKAAKTLSKVADIGVGNYL